MILAASDTLQPSTEAAVEATKEAVSEVGQFTQYFQDNLPALIGFGVRVLLALVFFMIGRVVIGWIRKIVRHSIERSSADKGVEQFIDSLLKFVLYAFLIFCIATKLGVESSSVAALIASAGVAVGLALQGSLSNFAGGVLILFLKPFVVGDYIIEDSHKNEGTVKEVSVFYTKLSTVDNKIVVIPNGALANSSLTNVTTSDERQLDLRIGIAYNSDLQKAKQLLEDILKQDVGISQDKDIKVFVDELGESAVVLGFRAWSKMDDYWDTRWRLLESIKLTFDKEGIEIPYNQLKVHIETPETGIVEKM